jgi:hypothetical protein
MAENGDLMTAAQWLAREIIGNDVHGFDPLPKREREQVAMCMYVDSFLGWPSVEAAQRTLDEWEWA